MTERFSHRIFLRVIGLALVCLVVGCAGIDRKLDEWELGRKIRESKFTRTMKSWESSLAESFSGREEQEPAVDEAAAENLPAKEPTGVSDTYLHTVKYCGENLEVIARWYTGDAGNWQELAAVNPDLDPRHLKPGTQVSIPAAILVTREPLPEDLAARQPSTCYQHTVRWRGESLSLIARGYTGRSANWRRLLE